MSVVNPTGPPAFPQQPTFGCDASGALSGVYGGGGGMSLRDYFATAALTGILARDDDSLSPNRRAEYAYVHADAMLAARE
jgi:hypothetical protein